MKQYEVLKSRHIGNMLITALAAGFVLLICQGAMAGGRLQLAGEKTFVDEQSGLMWQLDRSKRIKDLNEAMEIVSELNNGQYSNWRFPTKDELFELFQVFDLKNNGDVKTRLEGNYWLVDQDGSMKAGSWEIGDGCGPSRTFYAKTGGYVRAVRTIP